MATVKRLVEEASAKETSEGVEITEVFFVDEISGDPEKKFRLALTAPGIPRLGTPHPDFGDIIVVEVSPRFKGPTQAHVTIQYRRPSIDKGDPAPGGIGAVLDLGTISVGATTSERETTEDINGRPLQVSHIVQVDDGLGGTEDDLQTQIRTAQVSTPQVVLRISRLEAGSPDAKARQYVGTTNAKPVGKDPPRSWLCTRIEGSSNDGGKTYSVNYEFQYNVVTFTEAGRVKRNGAWGFLARFIDKETGFPILTEDLNTGKETLFYLVYEEEDFSALDIAFEGII